MSLLARIDTDYKVAFKAQQSATVSTLRVLRSALKNKQIELLRELKEEEVLAVVKSQVKQLRDALTTFESAGREDLAEGNRAELVILEAYLPEELSDEELEKIVKEAIEQTGARAKTQMGQVMGYVMKAVAGRADGARVKGLLESLFVMVIFTLSAQGVHAEVSFSPSVPVPQYIELLIRIGRIGLVVVGIYAVVEILRGAFTYMTSSNRDHYHGEALRSIAIGVISSLLVVGLFSIATVALNQLS